MVIFMVGSPLSGKSTIGKQIAKELNLDYFSTGDFAKGLGMDYREKSIKEEDISKEFDDKIIDEVVRLSSTCEDVIIDGFPRSEKQILIANGLGNHCVVIYLYLDPKVIAERASTRQREGDNREDYVIGRINSSIRLKMKLQSVYARDLVVYTIKGDGTDKDKLKQYVEEFVYVEKLYR